MIKPAHAKRFHKLIRELVIPLEEIRKYEPQANYYLANDCMNLMTGPTHEDMNEDERPLYENIAEYEILYGSDGGDW